jgi:hypothetical protein
LPAGTGAGSRSIIVSASPGPWQTSRGVILSFVNLLAVGTLLFWVGHFYGRVAVLEESLRDLKLAYLQHVETSNQTHVTRQTLEDWIRALDQRLARIEAAAMQR